MGGDSGWEWASLAIWFGTVWWANFSLFSSFSDAANAAQQNAMLCSTGPAHRAKYIWIACFNITLTSVWHCYWRNSSKDNYAMWIWVVIELTKTVIRQNQYCSLIISQCKKIQTSNYKVLITFRLRKSEIRIHSYLLGFFNCPMFIERSGRLVTLETFD